MGVKAYAAKAAKGRLEPFEYEPGPLGPHEVEVRVGHCGICHSDLGMIDNDFGFATYPLVPGHEVIGTIAAVGSHVDASRVGQRVGVGWHCGSCGHCEWCGRGLESFCAEDRPTIVRHHGGWAESVRCDGQVRRADPRRARIGRRRPPDVRGDHGLHADGSTSASPPGCARPSSGSAGWATWPCSSSRRSAAR